LGHGILPGKIERKFLFGFGLTRNAAYAPRMAR
jgi:hypothetical protein